LSKEKKALITGVSGQDGAYLSKLLLEKGYKVIGGDRRAASNTFWRLKKLNILQDIEIVNLDVCEFSNIFSILKKYQPDEIYNMAAQSFVGSSFDLPIVTADSTAIGALRILESIKSISMDSKYYQASSSEMFGMVQENLQSENTKFYPRSPYAVSKVFAHMITINYRESYNLHCSNGILFNHESPLRGESFVTRKIVKGLVNVKNNKQDLVEIGNLEAKRDWGYAADYVEAMYLMLQQKKGDDYVIATGKTTSVKEFINKVCTLLDLKLIWNGSGVNEVGINSENNKTIIKINPKFYRPSEVDFLLGDYSKARKKLSWEPKHNLDQLIEIMVNSELNDLKI
jgi:GDPmannose 4,6-dehydratase